MTVTLKNLGNALTRRSTGSLTLPANSALGRQTKFRIEGGIAVMFVRKAFFLSAVLLVIFFIISPQLAVANNYKAFKYGDSWQTLSYDGKLMFIEGYMEGLAQGIHDANYVITGKKSIDGDKMEKALNMHNPLYHTEVQVLIKVMDDIYKDPANIYIQYDLVLWLAKDKLDGKPIEEHLRIYRKRYSNTPKE